MAPITVALCMAGPVSRAPEAATLEAAHLAAQALGADVFAVLTARGHMQLPSSLTGWVTRYQLFEDGAGLAGLRAECAAANKDNRSNELLAAYASVGGNFLGPLVGHDGRNAFLLRDLWRCLQLVRRHESLSILRYHYVAFSRIDIHWFAPPPPLKFFLQADPDAIWLPDGQDWDGVNDRFALVPRRWADAFFGRWPRLLNGSLLSAVRSAAGHRRLDLKFEAGPEWLLLAALRRARATVLRFSPVAAVLCASGSKRGRYGRCTRPSGPLGLSFKYSSEASEAQANVARLGAVGWEWRGSNASPFLKPRCFESEDQQQSCCDSLNGLNGHANCWTDVYSFARCCTPSRLGLWVLPLATAAQELLEAGVSPVCWPVVTAVEMCLGVAEFQLLVS